MRDRRQVLVGAAAALTLVAGLAVAAYRAPRDPAARPAAAPGPASPAPTATPSPDDYGDPVLGTPPPRRPAPAGTPTATPTPTAGPGGYRTIRPPYLPRTVPRRCTEPPAGRGTPPAPGLRLDVFPWAAESVVQGRPHGTVTVTNDGTARARFVLHQPHEIGGTLFGAGGRPLSAQYRDGWSTVVDLAPGEAASFTFRAAAWTCGPEDRGDYLPAGRYDLAAVLLWSTPGDTRAVHWSSGRTPVRLVAPEPVEQPCDHDTTGCEPLPPRAFCRSDAVPSGDFGARRDLRLTVTPDSRAVRAGEPLAMTATVSNDGAEPYALYVYADMTGALLEDPDTGPVGSRRLAGSRVVLLDVPPGGTRTVQVRALTTACDGDRDGAPLPPGEYVVPGGVYVTGFGWWAAPTTNVLLTP